MFNPKTIQSALKPIFYFTKVFGLSPFTIEQNRYENSILNVLWSISVMTIIVSYSFVSINYKSHDKTGIITRVTNALHVNLCVVSLFVGLLFGCIYRKKIVEVINDLSEIDKNVKALHMNINIKDAYRRGMIYFTIALFFTALTITAIVFLDVLAFLKTPDIIAIGELVAYNSPIITIFVEFQFCTLSLLLKQRFSWLNDKMVEVGKHINVCMNSQKNHITLSKVTTAIIDTKFMKFTQTKAFSTLEQISEKHYELCNISKKLNAAYSSQILLLIVQCFMSIIAMSFYLAKYIFSNVYGATRMDYRMYFGPTLLLYSAAVVILTVVCSSTAKQAQKTGALLHRVVSLYLCINDGYLDLGVTCFSLQLLHQKVNFTACKMFVIDETLLSTIVGAATTYLVIVLQFEIGVDISNGNLANFTTSL